MLESMKVVEESKETNGINCRRNPNLVTDMGISQKILAWWLDLTFEKILGGCKQLELTEISKLNISRCSIK